MALTVTQVRRRSGPKVINTQKLSKSYPKSPKVTQKQVECDVLFVAFPGEDRDLHCLDHLLVEKENLSGSLDEVFSGDSRHVLGPEGQQHLATRPVGPT